MYDLAVGPDATLSSQPRCLPSDLCNAAETAALN